MKFHTATVVVYREHKVTYEPEFLVHMYQWTPSDTGVLTPPEPRYVSGTNLGFPYETPEETAARKLLDEAGLTCRKFREISSRTIRNVQTKYGYLVNRADCEGELRRAGRSVGGKVMSHPFWMSEREMRWVMRNPHPHQWLCEASLKELEAVCC